MSITSDKLVFLTPSYRNDVERFLLLRSSIKHFCEDPHQHIVLVPSKDVALFKNKSRGDSELIILEQEEFIHPRFYASSFLKIIDYLAPSQSWRLARFKGKSGWIHQQIIKLCLPQLIDTAPVLIADSDMFFVDTISKEKLGLCNKAKVLMRDTPSTESGKHREHMKCSREILGLPPGSTEHHYMTSPQIWYPEYVSLLREHLENTYQLDWQLALHKSGSMSEYLLYGLFVEEFIKPKNLSIAPPLPYYIAWDDSSYSKAITAPLECLENNLSLVIQSNIGHEASEYKHIFEQAASKV